MEKLNGKNIGSNPLEQINFDFVTESATRVSNKKYL